MVADVPHPTAGSFKMVASPMKLSETPCEIRRHPPLLGEHTDEVLAEILGYDAAKVDELRRAGII